MSKLIKVKSKICPICKQQAEFQVTEEGYNNFINGGLVQRCFPELTPKDHERLITGICAECWDRIFS